MKIRIFTLLFILFAHITFAQNKQLENKFLDADALYSFKQYDKALPIFLELENSTLKGIVSKSELLFKIGFCYYNSDLDKENCVNYFREYLKRSTKQIEARYFLAKTLHYFHQFDEAIEEYEKFKNYFNTKPEIKEKFKPILATISTEINRCNYGKIVTRESTEAVIENLGPIVNSKYSEYAPVINHSENELAFTRRSPDTKGGKLSPDGNYFEDIYIVDITGGSLFGQEIKATKAVSGYFSLLKRFKSTEPSPIGDKINTKSHDGAIQFSADDKTLYIYHDFDVWTSILKEDEWQKPRKKKGIHKVVNSKSFEPSISISNDGKLMFVSSDRVGGYGGLDIYMSEKKEDGTWSDLVNLGSEINTPLDEDGPYIDPNNKTLYFSSKGHSSMGGFDVFKTHRNSNNWSEPQNMGFPLNSAGDDIFYMMTPLFNRAYYASNKYGGYGKMDIYRITFSDERTPLAEIKGFIKEGDRLIPAKAKLTILDAETGEKLYHVFSDSNLGEYKLMFGHGKKYNMEIELEGFLPYKKHIYIPNQVDYYQYYQEIHHKHIYDNKGNKIGEVVEMHNVFDKEDELAQLTTEDINKIIKEKTPADDYQILSHVTFFVSEDSVKNLIQQNIINRSDIPILSNISYYNSAATGKNVYDKNSSDTINLSQSFIVGAIDVFQTDKFNNRINLSQTTRVQNLVVKLENVIVYLEENKNSENTERLNYLKQTVADLKNKNIEPYSKITDSKLENALIEELTVNSSNNEDYFTDELYDLITELHVLTNEVHPIENTVNEITSQPVISTEALFEVQKTLARAEYSLSNLYDVLENPSIYNKQHKAKIQESTRIISKAKLDLSSARKILEKDPNHSISARESLEETELMINKTGIAIALMDKLLSDNSILNDTQKDSLTVVKHLLAKTQASLIQTQVAFNQTPEEEKTFSESYTETENKFKEIEKLMTKVNNNSDTLNLSEIDMYSIQKQIIQTELSLFKTLKLAELDQQNDASDSLREKLIKTQQLLAEVESDIFEITDLKNSLDVPLIEIKQKMKATHLLMTEAIKITTTTEKEMESVEKEIINNVKIINTSPIKDTLSKNTPLIAPTQKIPSATIYFKYDKSSISQQSIADINTIKDFMKSHPKYKCKVIGHTDSKGSKNYNLDLSKRRAKTVKQFMVKMGIDSPKLIVSGMGETNPISPNNNPDNTDNPNGRMLNRRVELILYK